MVGKDPVDELAKKTVTLELGREDSGGQLDARTAFDSRVPKTPFNTPGTGLVSPGNVFVDASSAANAALAGDDAKEQRVKEFIDSLPKPVQRRVKALQTIGNKRNALYKKFRDERRALEMKYEQLYVPMFNKRTEIVTGKYEPTDAEAGPDAPPLSSEEAKAVTGVPNFWLTAMKNHIDIADAIQEKDEGVLKYLQDVQCSLLQESKGFRLTFTFAENEYFANKELTKTYIMADDDEDPTLEKAEGTKVEWKPSKNVTVKLMRKKQKAKRGGGQRTIEKEEPCDSFFNFFSPPELPGDDAELDEEEEENLHSLLEADYELGKALQEKVVPNAVKWYTGEDVEYPMYGDEEDEEGSEDDEDDDDDDDDDDEPVRGKGKGGKGAQAGKGGGKGGKPATGGEQPKEECKQQ